MGNPGAIDDPDLNTMKETPKSYDVAIAGGGVAGVAAALEAARNGMNTALLEKTIFTGRLATTPSYCLPRHRPTRCRNTSCSASARYRCN